MTHKRNHTLRGIVSSVGFRLLDILLIWGIMIFSVRFIYPETYMYARELLFLSGVAYTIAYLLFAQIFKIFRRSWEIASINDLVYLLLTIGLSVVVVLAAQMFYMRFFSKRFTFLVLVLSVLVLGGLKLGYRIFDTLKISSGRNQGDRALIVGAGRAGTLLLDRIHKSDALRLKPVGFIDLTGEHTDRMILGLPILGLLDDVGRITQKHKIKRIIIADDIDSYKQRQEIFKKCHVPGVEINVLPVFDDIITGDLKISTVRKVNVEDLLGRDRVDLDMQQGESSLGGKTILITGAGGSIGSEISRQLLKYRPARLILMGHGENSIYQIHREQRKNTYGVEMIPVIRDIKDLANCEEIFAKYRPEIVYHAAAHKHVPLMEANPKEAIRNNVFGTKNIAELADKYGVERFVMLSTDKAVNPTSVMGATKRIAEEIIREINKTSKTRFVAVRFGNVIGSRGSVIPLFQEQIEKGGPITLTDKRMTRYFMAIPEAASLVIQAGEIQGEGEIFVLDMGDKVCIYDLAKDMVRLAGFKEGDIPILEVGIREGEKITEEYITDKEHITGKVMDKIFVGRAAAINPAELQAYLQTILTQTDEEATQRTVHFANNI